MKKLPVIIGIILLTATVFSQTKTSYSDAQAYIVYNKANEFYRNKEFDKAKATYYQVVRDFPGSRYVPYSLYMLSFIENDYLKIIDYLNRVKDNYPDFKYWQNALEKLGDIYYIMGQFNNAAEQYELAKTDKSWYMLGIIRLADQKYEQAIDAIRQLLTQTKDNQLAYKGLLIKANAYILSKKYASAVKVLQESLKLKQWAFDKGARILFYAGKCYFYTKNYPQALYIFSLLRTTMPLSAEAQLSKNYLTYLEEHNIIVAQPVKWLEKAFTTPVTLPFQGEQAMIAYDQEVEAEKVVEQSESVAGKIVKTEVVEYVVRIGRYKDLSVANMVVNEIIQNQNGFSVGIYYRNDLYYIEIRGIQNLVTAKEYAKTLIALGYEDTKVVEVVKITKYGE